MSEILSAERVRFARARAAEQGAGEGREKVWNYLAGLIVELADSHEALRARVAALEAALDAQSHLSGDLRAARARIDDLEAENERLRRDLAIKDAVLDIGGNALVAERDAALAENERLLVKEATDYEAWASMRDERDAALARVRRESW